MKLVVGGLQATESCLGGEEHGYVHSVQLQHPPLDYCGNFLYKE